MRRLSRLILLTAIVALAGAGAIAVAVKSYLTTPLDLGTDDYVLVVPEGATLASVSRQLADDRVLRWPRVLAWVGRATGVDSQVRAGEYRLQAGQTADGLLDLLVAGKVVLHTITLVEGWTVPQVLAALRAEPAVQRTLRANDAISLARELALDWPSAEGAFLPETYSFARDTTDASLLRQAHAALRGTLADAWKGRPPDLPLSNEYEALTLASIVERETALASERPEIAGVFVRRLRLGMRLQTDPTVIYGLGPRFDGNLTRRDLEADTPWNTYTRGGLPPTPIALPGAAAIRAALNPAAGTALFFVASGAGDGSHRFSATLEEHNAAVAAYLATLRRRP